MRSATQADPAWFVRHGGLLVLDEVQRVQLRPLSQGEIDRTAGWFFATMIRAANR